MRSGGVPRSKPSRRAIIAPWDFFYGSQKDEIWTVGGSMGTLFCVYYITCPVAQLVERWTPGSVSPGPRRSGARYMKLLTGMAGWWEQPRPVEVS